MEVYILRHAIAVPRGTPGYPNDDRPLTDEGIEKMTRAAEGIANVVKNFNLILTSPLSRAQDTARITARALKCEENVQSCSELLPGSSPKNLLSLLEKNKDKDRVLLVGHEPDLGYLASSLLGSLNPVIAFKKGSLCRIDLMDFSLEEPGTLIWHLTPKQLRMLAEA